MARTATNTRKKETLAAQKAVRCALVDRLGRIEAELAPMKLKQKEATELRALISTWPEADGIPDSRPVIYEGETFAATVTARENRSRADMVKAFLYLGKAKFLELCSVTLEALKKNLSVEELAEVVEVKQDGPRKVNTMIRSGAVEKAA